MILGVVELTNRGRLTVPQSVRKLLELHEGDFIIFRKEGNSVVLRRLK